MSEWFNRIKGKAWAAMRDVNLQAAREKAIREGRHHDWPEEAKRKYVNAGERTASPAKPKRNLSKPVPELKPKGVAKSRVMTASERLEQDRKELSESSIREIRERFQRVRGEKAAEKGHNIDRGRGE